MKLFVSNKTTKVTFKDNEGEKTKYIIEKE